MSDPHPLTRSGPPRIDPPARGARLGVRSFAPPFRALRVGRRGQLLQDAAQVAGCLRYLTGAVRLVDSTPSTVETCPPNGHIGLYWAGGEGSRSGLVSTDRPTSRAESCAIQRATTPYGSPEWARLSVPATWSPHGYPACARFVRLQGGCSPDSLSAVASCSRSIERDEAVSSAAQERG